MDLGFHAGDNRVHVRPGDGAAATAGRIIESEYVRVAGSG
jgi:hypothetical protein